MGLGQVGGREGGPSGRLAHLALLGWAPLRLQAGAAAAGARYQMKLSSHCSRGGREDGEGATGVSLYTFRSERRRNYNYTWDSRHKP